MRPALAAACLTIFAPLATACFDGNDALGLTCTKDSQCGDDQSCGAAGLCVANGDDGNDDGNDDGSTTDGYVTEPCVPPPPPSYCKLGKEIEDPKITYNEFTRSEFGHATAIVAGDFVGDDHIDLAVLSMDEAQLHMVSNDGEANYMIADSWSDVNAPETYDVITTDRQCDGETEFVVLSYQGSVTVANWNPNNGALETTGQLTLEPGLFSLAVADLVDDGLNLPEVLISGNAHVSLLPNYSGAYDPGGVVQVGSGGEFYEPWATLIVGGSLTDARILVAASNDQSFDAASNQVVHVLRTTATGGGYPIIEKNDPPVLASDFRNPFAIAAGNLDGDPGATIEIVVAERNLDGPAESTTLPGRLRFFRLIDDVVTEIVEGGIEIGVGPRALVVADLDCDGKDDVVIGHNGRNGMHDGIPEVLFGTDDFNSATPVPVDVGGISSGSRMAVGDFDDDGRPEVAIPDYGRDVDEPGDRIVFIDVEEE